MSNFFTLNIKRVFFLAVLSASGILVSLPAFAECGGNGQCIGIGASSADALQAHHGGPNVTPVFAFGSQNVATTSTSRTIFVEAVTGPGGTMAILGAITITGADASEFQVTGGNCSTTNGPVHGAAGCTIDVAFSPVTSGSKAATLNVALNPPCANCITGRMAVLTGSGGLVDLSTDIMAGGLVVSQALTAARFSRAQIFNIQSRMGSLHKNKSRSVSKFTGGAVSKSVPGITGNSTAMLASPAAAQMNRRIDNQSQASLAENLYTMVSSQSFDLSYSSNASDPGATSTHEISLWVEGNVNFGRRDASTDSTENSVRFTTDGLSAGIDNQFGDKLILGLGLGMASDRASIGTGGSRSAAEATSLFVYGSYRLSQNTYLDALIGESSLDFELDRYIPSVDDFARGQRDGDQMFFSLLASYEYQNEALLLSPYFRLDSSVDNLNGFTETGVSANAITYSAETLRSKHYSLGLRVESIHKTNFGWALPQFRAEWIYKTEGDRQTKLAYANQPPGTIYTLNSAGDNSNSILLGIGSDFIYPGGLVLTANYSLSRTSDQDSDQSIGFSLSKDLDEEVFRPEHSADATFANPIQLEAGYLHSDNLNRASIPAYRLSDQVYTVKVGSRVVFPVSRYTRLLLKGYLSGDRLRRYDGLNKFTTGVKTEYQYRTSGAFDAVTFGLFGDVAYDEYDSDLRTGSRVTLGLSARQLFTEKISGFASVQTNTRDAKNTVFDTHSNEIRLIADYSVGRRGILYLSLQHRRGDLTASTPIASYYDAIAIASVADDAFTNQALTSTRFEAKTNISSLGYNWALGSRDSIDLSWMNIKSNPDTGAGNVGYSTTQISLAYFMRF